jgi:hypothetical protein
MYETPLQSSPVDCQAYSAHDNMFIQIGPSMCSISELMGKKNSKTTTTTTDYSKKTYSTKLGYIFHHQFPVPNTFYTRDPTNSSFCHWVLSELLSPLVSSCQSTNLSTE